MLRDLSAAHKHGVIFRPAFETVTNGSSHFSPLDVCFCCFVLVLEYSGFD